jgi:hypothetical protein
MEWFKGHSAIKRREKLQKLVYSLSPPSLHTALATPFSKP